MPPVSIVANDRTPARDYDYVEVPRRASLSEAERLSLYRETLASNRERVVESMGHLSAAKKAYERLTERSPNVKTRNHRRHLWIALRLENEFRHDAATTSAPTRMVANMLDNWPAWYPQHLKPSPEVAAEDAKRRAKKRRSRKTRIF